MATDGGAGSTARTGVAIVTVNIRDLADNVPLFDQTSYTFFVDELSNNANVGTVVVSGFFSLVSLKARMSPGRKKKEERNWTLFGVIDMMFVVSEVTSEVLRS